VDLKTLRGFTSRKVSSHYVIGRQKDGNLWQLVDEDKKAWHAGPYNSRSIGIEVVAKPGQVMTRLQAATLKGLLEYLLDKYNLPYQAILTHGMLVPTKCPGDIFGTQGFLGWRKATFTQDDKLI
jgi:N-acetyl-anhydromuramyl-L-alanine amidase AmpD